MLWGCAWDSRGRDPAGGWDRIGLRGGNAVRIRGLGLLLVLEKRMESVRCRGRCAVHCAVCLAIEKDCVIGMGDGDWDDTVLRLGGRNPLLHFLLL